MTSRVYIFICRRAETFTAIVWTVWSIPLSSGIGSLSTATSLLFIFFQKNTQPNFLGGFYKGRNFQAISPRGLSGDQQLIQEHCSKFKYHSLISRLTWPSSCGCHRDTVVYFSALCPELHYGGQCVYVCVCVDNGRWGTTNSTINFWTDTIIFDFRETVTFELAAHPLLKLAPNTL